MKRQNHVRKQKTFGQLRIMDPDVQRCAKATGVFLYVATYKK